MPRLYVERRKQPRMTRASTSGDATRAMILDEAAKMFRCFGYENTSLAMIAEAQNLTAPAIYRHFDSKYGLFAESVTKLQVGFDERMERVSEHLDQSAAARIHALTVAHTQHQLQRAIPRGIGLNTVLSIGQLARHLKEPERSDVLALQRKHLHRVRSIVEEGAASGEFDVVDPTVTAFSLIALPEHLVLWYKPTGAISEDAVAQVLADLAVRMCTDDAASSELAGR
ncbi:MAG: TetR/AcrR family transcriptional regulator [Beutenbergiaceae bacterium]